MSSWKHNLQIKKCEEWVQKFHQNETAFWDIKVLFIGGPNGGPYLIINQGIIEDLKGLVREIITATPTENIINLTVQTHPDLVLVLLGDQTPYEQILAIRNMGIKTAVWLTDDPYYTDVTTLYAQYYDFIFTNELSCVSLYQTLGCPQVHYLPFAANTNIFYPNHVDTTYLRDICFIGTAWNNRISFFDSVAKYLANMNIIIIGPLWNKLMNYSLLSNKIIPTGIPCTTTANYFNGAKIVINLHRSHDDETLFKKNTRNLDAYSINPRTFEISACGAFQLTDVRQDLNSYYTPGYDIATYASPNEFIEKIIYYLQHEDERYEIAFRGFQKTMREHTFRTRMVKMLKIIFG
jgi:spore maturation protein CgeB